MWEAPHQAFGLGAGLFCVYRQFGACRDLRCPGIAGIAEHIGRLDVIHMLDLDHPAALAVAQMRRDGVPAGVAAAVHAARHLPEWGSRALVATVEPKAYAGQGVGVFDLNR
ncbi:hypothetical protein AB0D29_37935 [Streptomyces sp. NPDC048424]|uniref:hypothetical protein n=1 Tax=Streptomyces sp. NPDC048424 TaxID=3155265 RepID=UPI00341B510C